MNIVVFDDDEYCIKLMQKLLNELNIKHNRIFNEPTCFNNADEIKAYADANKEINSLFLLDIMANGVQVGFTISEHVKKVNKYNLVIHVSDYRAPILFNTMKHERRALEFIHKDSNNLQYELERALLYVYDIFKGDYFIGESFTQNVFVKYEDIYYFRRDKQSMTIAHKYGINILEDNFNDFANKLNSHFCYATNEIIVNTQNITRMSKLKKKNLF